MVAVVVVVSLRLRFIWDCIAGFVFSHFSNDFAFSAYLPEKNFALMGMAGVMSGVMHAPLTGVFLIAELTGGYDLFLPLMIVSVSSYLTIIAFDLIVSIRCV